MSCCLPRTWRILAEWPASVAVKIYAGLQACRVRIAAAVQDSWFKFEQSPAPSIELLIVLRPNRDSRGRVKLVRKAIFSLLRKISALVGGSKLDRERAPELRSPHLWYCRPQRRSVIVVHRFRSVLLYSLLTDKRSGQKLERLYTDKEAPELFGKRAKQTDG